MSGIIEIWRKQRHSQQPVRFMVGSPPELTDGNAVGDGDITVKSIVFRELKTLGKLRFDESLFCITFENSPVQRLIPASEITEIAYETKEVDEVKTPAMEL